MEADSPQCALGQQKISLVLHFNSGTVKIVDFCWEGRNLCFVPLRSFDILYVFLVNEASF